MPYIANMTNANALVAAGELVGNGQCVALAHAAALIPPTQAWSQGTRVQGNLQLPVGTIIATFDANGHYGNHTNGTSHTAIYIGQTAQGIQVLDQWKGSIPSADHPPQSRTISFNHLSSKKVNQGESYYVVQ